MRSYFIVSFLALFATLSSLLMPVLALPAGNVTEIAELEARGKSGIAAGALGWIDAILKGIENDNKKRAEFTKSLVTDLYNQNPAFNYVVCHVRHDKRFDGAQGVDWAHSHRELDIKIGGTIGYEIYAFRSGEFWRRGDGGWINWAWIGHTSQVDENGSHLVFVNPA